MLKKLPHVGYPGRMSMSPYPVQFFGTRWDAPVVDNAVEAPIPVGELCLYCDEPIETGDRGLFTTYVDLGADGKPESHARAVHMECNLRASVGSLAHLEGRCSCHGGTDYEGYSRANARAVLTWVNENWRRGDPL